MGTNGPKNICPKCGYNREPNAPECPKCGIIFAKIKPVDKNEEIEKESRNNISEPPEPDIDEIEFTHSLTDKRNFLYNLNTRVINQVLFAITAIIAGILIFIYFLYLTSHE